MRTVLRSGTLVTMNPKRDILENCDLLLEDDRIAGIFSQEGRRKVDADSVLNCQGKIIIPGLVSAHSHLTGIFQRGLWNELTFENWLSHSTATERIANFSAKDLYALHCAACIEFLRHGVTTVLNMFSVRPSLDLDKIEAGARAFADTGIRGILAVMLKDQSLDGEKIVPEPIDAKTYISFARDAADIVAKVSPRITFMLAPSAPQWCSDQLLIACRELAEELLAGIHTHLLETKQHAELGRRLYGEPMVKHLEKIEFLNPKLSVAHANWLEEAEIDVLKKHDVKVIHNPSANMKLGSGVAQVKKMLRTGLTMGMGADSVNAGTVYSIFEQMKLAVLLPRIVWEPENWVLPDEAFAMGSVGGAQALLLDELVGSIEEGKKADLVILSPGTSLLPMNDLVAQLVLCENGESVESVFVDGKLVLSEGRLETIREMDVLVSLSSLTARIQQAHKRVLEADIE